MSITTLALTGKISVAFGLSWRTLDAYESRHAQITQWRSEGYAYFASSRAEGDRQFGLASESEALETAGKDARLYSAAALLALHPRLKGQTVLVLLQGADEVYAVGLQGGGITIDEALAYQEVSSLRARFTKECQQHERDFEVVGVLEGQSASPELGQLDATLPWSALVRKAMPAAARIAALRSARAFRLAALAFVLLAAAAALGQGYRWHQERQERQRRLAARQANDPALLYAQAVERFVSRPSAMAPAASAARALRSLIGAIATQRAAWQLRRIDCDTAAAACVAEWVPDTSRLGTFADFKAAAPALPADWKLEFGPKLERLRTSFALSAPRAAIQEAASRPSYQDFLGAEGSRLQALAGLGFGVSLKEPQLLDVGSGTPEAVARTSPVALRAAGWAVSSQPWWLLQALERLGPNVSLDVLSVTFTGRDVRFSAEGKIYVRN